MEAIIPRAFKRSAYGWLSIFCLAGLSIAFFWAASTPRFMTLTTAERGWFLICSVLLIGVIGLTLVTAWYPLRLDASGLQQGRLSIAWADITAVEIKQTYVFRATKLCLIVRGHRRDANGHPIKNNRLGGVWPLDQLDDDRSVLLTAILTGLQGRGIIVGKDTSGAQHRTCKCGFLWEMRSNLETHETSAADRGVQAAIADTMAQG